MTPIEYGAALDGYLERIGARKGRLPLIDREEAEDVFEAAARSGLLH